jgi:hypothetical protein
MGLHNWPAIDTHAVAPYKQCASMVQMGGDVGALLSAPGWLFIGLPHEVQVIVIFPSNCIDIP